MKFLTGSSLTAGKKRATMSGNQQASLTEPLFVLKNSRLLL